MPRAQAPDWGLLGELHALIDHADPRLALVSSLEDVGEALVLFEASVRSTMWNMQRHVSLISIRDATALNERSRRRGIEMRYVLPARVAERRCPLVSSCYPYLRLAEVGHPLLIADSARMLVGSADGDSVWVTSDPDLVRRGVRHYDAVWQQARPAVPEGQEPPFTRRMIDIGLLLVEGASDHQIATTLGVSQPTVSSDVREMSNRLGARSRAQAIARISGIDG